MWYIYDMRQRLYGLILLVTSYALAAAPVATLTAGPGVMLNGRPLQTVGAPNWPVSQGDEIVTGDASAVLTVADGTVLTLRPHTRVVIQQCDRCIVQLFSGSVAFRKPAGSNFEFCALGRPVRPQPGTEGAVIIEAGERVVVQATGEEQLITAGDCACNTGAPWAASGKKTKIAIIVVAAATATGVTIAVTRPEDKSPATK